MTYETIRYDLTDGVATITLFRPDRLNALTPRLLTEMLAAIRAAEADGARALVLTGEGRAFCSGADLIGDKGEGLPDDLGELLDSYYHPVVQALADLDVPVVTAMNGPAVGAGLSIALSGDIVVAARSSYLLLAFANIGLVPDAGATWFVAKAIGRAKALEMALLGERIPAEKAVELGLIARVADDEAVLDEARAIALRLAKGPTLALGLIRKQFQAALGCSLEETLAVEKANQSKAGYTHDFKEAVAAFADKRAPKFEGR